MLRRTPRRVRSLLAAAAACAGANGLLISTANAQIDPAVPAEAVAPNAVVDQARALADDGKLVHAYELLSDLLTGSTVSLTDIERYNAATLSDQVNRRIQFLDSYEVSLQKADYSLGLDDLRSASHHANAVFHSGTASADQTVTAEDLLRRIAARRAQLQPAMQGRFQEALRAMDAGRFAEAKDGLTLVSRSGVTLSDADRDRLNMAMEEILLLETSRGERFDAPVAAGVLQAGVVTRQVGTQPEDDDAGVVTRQDDSQPDTNQAGQPDSQPELEGDDLTQVARRLEAQSTLTEANIAYGEGRWADARVKYQRVVNQFAGYVSDADLQQANERIAEASARLGAGQTNLLDDVLSRRTIEAGQKKAEFDTNMEQARIKLETGDIGGARDAAAAAQVSLATAKSRQLFSESDWAAMASQLTILKGEIGAEEERQIRVEAAQREGEAAVRAAEAAVRRERERAQKITEAIDRVRALQAEMKYREALEVVENQILFLDPISPSGLLLRDMLRDNLIYGTFNRMVQDRNFDVSDQALDNFEAMLAPRGIVNYPADWPAISARRAGVEAGYESPADRRVIASLDSTQMPVSFQDNTLEQVLDFVAVFTKLDMDVDWDSMDEIGIGRDTTVSLNLKQASAKTVLDRVLDKVSIDQFGDGVDWAVMDGMVYIASEDRIRRHTVLETYDIRDLVFEVPDHEEAPEIDLQSVLQSSQGGGGGQSPFRDDQQDDQDRIPLDERIDQIKEIIVRNVDEQSWPEGGGDTGAMYDLNGLLLIKNTPKNHREIQGLLSKLRESKAMQINVETRFLLVAQDFFEQIGFDLDVYFNADNNQVRVAQAADNTVQPGDFFDFNDGGGLLRDITGSVTNDIDQGVINPDPWSPIGNSQNSLGLAAALMPGEGIASTILGEAPALGIAGQFLDDVQVDFLVTATQADRRSIQLTAPRLTFTNGQVSNIYVVTQQSFVSDLQPIVSDSAVGFDPTLEVVSEGVVMLVEGQVTADRRYVLLNVDTAVSQIEGFAQQPVTAVAGGQLVSSSDTQSFIQLPTVTVTRVQTTVTVPDQGTVLLGGQRLVNETEVETGVPVLSKIPVINRFFTNRIESREEQTLLILIKPTVLIQSEQEEINNPGLNQMLGLGG